MSYTKGEKINFVEIDSHGCYVIRLTGANQEFRKNLMIASIDMYEALKAIIAECPNPKLPYGKRVVEIATEALAKVEGK